MDARQEAPGEPVTISLTNDEALVLHHWLGAHEDLPTNHQAEQRVLWDLEAVLERVLAFRPDYDAIIARARAAVQDPPAPAA